MTTMPKLLAPGTVLGGRYRIAGLAGSGGSSFVYAAADLKLPGKRWAVKQMLPQPDFGSRLEEEASMLIALEHPRLPRIVDFFPAEHDDCRFLVMDYIEGITLEAFMRQRGFIPLEVLIDIAEQICEGLQYLHSREPPIIYRDLKPTNLMVEEGGEIRFIDFGTARSYKPLHAEDTVKLGTVGFAAPEQYAGVQSDARTDLYALGAILLYLASAGKYSDWRQTGGRALIRKDLPPGFIQIIRKLLMNEPVERYSSALELAAELRKLKSLGQSFGQGFDQQTERRFEHGRELRRTTVIAVAGSGPGLGTTHFSLLLAHSLAGRFPKVTVMEWSEKPGAFLNIREFMEVKSLADGAGFKIGRVAYRMKPSRMELLQLLNGGSDLVVMDLGSSIDKEGLEEFARADLQLILLPGAVWRRAEAESCLQLFSSAGGRNRAYVVPHGETSSIRQLSRLVKGSKCWGIPHESSPFAPGEESVHAIERICESILPVRHLSAAGRLARWLWRKMALEK